MSALRSTCCDAPVYLSRLSSAVNNRWVCGKCLEICGTRLAIDHALAATKMIGVPRELLIAAAEGISILNDDSRRDFPRWEDLERRLREAVG